MACGTLTYALGKILVTRQAARVSPSICAWEMGRVSVVKWV